MVCVVPGVTLYAVFVTLAVCAVTALSVDV